MGPVGRRIGDEILMQIDGNYEGFPVEFVHCLGTSTRWEPSPGYKWSYGVPVNGLMNGSLQLGGVILPCFLTGDGAFLVQTQFLERDCVHPDFSGVRYTPTKETH